MECIVSKIKNIISRQILDSRGRPTIEVDIFNEKGESARAAVPSGASVGRFEAIELRDGWKDFNGLGVQKVINNIQNIIKPALLGLDSLDQNAIDLILLKLDNSENKSNLGANAILATSIANAKLAALSENKIFASYISEKYRGSKIEKNNFPRAMVNIINGGAHAKTNLAFQEFMIFPRTNNIHDILRISCEIFYNLYDLLQEKGMLTLTGDEGGYAPNLSTAEEAIELILTAVKKAGYREYEDVMIAIDVAGNELMLSNNLYKISQTSEITSSELQEYYNILLSILKKQVTSNFAAAKAPICDCP